jgi:uncharacterized protein (DUF2141 family)
MRLLIIILFFITQLTILNAQTIKIEIIDIEIEKGGHLYVSLFNDADGYPKNEESFRKIFVKIDNDTMFIEFKNIPVGIYAINVLHDENPNKKIDTNFLGIPNEGYGFSYNPWFIGPPTFNKTKFDFCGELLKLKIEMNY